MVSLAGKGSKQAEPVLMELLISSSCFILDYAAALLHPSKLSAKSLRRLSREAHYPRKTLTIGYHELESKSYSWVSNEMISLTVGYFLLAGKQSG